MPQCWLNGQLVDEAQANVSIKDTGLLHGAGVFTTMRAHSGKAFRVADHLARLRASCEALSIPLGYEDAMLRQAVADLVAANSLSAARLRVTATRGAAGRDESGATRLEPNVFITATTLEAYPEEYYRKGMTVLAYDQQKLNPYDIQAGHKTLNYLSRLTAMRDAKSRGAGEALWFNVHNYLQSGSISNVFIVRSGKLFTAPTQQELDSSEVIRGRTPYPRSNVLPGIVRKTVLEIAQRQQIPVEIGPLTITDLLEADECFLTNSIMEVMPVCRIERKAIGTDKPGDLTRKITVLYRSAVDEYVSVA